MAMTSTVDANILIYAANSDSEFHARALDVLEQSARGPEISYLFWPVISAYLRLVTHTKVFSKPLNAKIAMQNIDQLVSRPHIRLVGETDDTWSWFQRLSDQVTPKAGIVTDIHIVALMKSHGVQTIYTHDRDFRRFDDITVIDPLV